MPGNKVKAKIDTMKSKKILVTGPTGLLAPTFQKNWRNKGA